MPLHPVQFIPRTFSSPLTLRTGSSLTFEDNVTLGFGTADGESTIKSDGTDTIWQMVSGGLTIGLGASAPVPDQDGVHIWKATAGNVTAIAGSLLTLEDSGDSFIQMLVPNANASGVYFGTEAANNTGWILYHGNLDTPSATLSLGVGGSARLWYSAGAFAFQEETTISTTAGDILLSPNSGFVGIGATSPAASVEVATAWGSASALNMMAAVTAYNADQARVVIRRAKGTQASPTAILSGDVLGSLQFRGYLAAAWGSASSGMTVVAAENFTATASGAYLTLSTIPLTTLTSTERVRITSEGVISTLVANPTNVTATGAGIYSGGIAITDVLNAWIDDATHGAGTVVHYIGDSAILTERTSATAFKQATSISTTTGALTLAPTGGSVLFTGTLALTGSRVTQSYHTNITSTNAVTVDSWSESKELMEPYGGDALAVLRGTEVISFRHKMDRDGSGRVKLGVKAESIHEPLALVDMDYGHGLGVGPALDTMGLTALNTRAIQQIEDILHRLEQENQELRALVAGRSN